VTDLAVIDVTTEEIAKFIKFHEGVGLALANIERLKPEEIARAGINADDFQHLLALIGDYRRADEVLPSAEKLVELLFETKLERAHRISLLLGEICAQARRRAARVPNGGEILGPLQDLLNYQYGPARQAAATRAKNAKTETPAPPAPDSGTPSPA
jgi:hypothetical protein